MSDRWGRNRPQNPLGPGHVAVVGDHCVQQARPDTAMKSSHVQIPLGGAFGFASVYAYTCFSIASFFNNHP